VNTLVLLVHDDHHAKPSFIAQHLLEPRDMSILFFVTGERFGKPSSSEQRLSRRIMP
jgi:hypothetical protein